MRRLRHIRPATSFRRGYAYDNVLYAVAGQLIEEVTGQTWEQFMLQHVLRAAGMRGATVNDAGPAPMSATFLPFFCVGACGNRSRMSSF